MAEGRPVLTAEQEITLLETPHNRTHVERIKAELNKKVPSKRKYEKKR